MAKRRYHSFGRHFEEIILSITAVCITYTESGCARNNRCLCSRKIVDETTTWYFPRAHNCTYLLPKWLGQPVRNEKRPDIIYSSTGTYTNARVHASNTPSTGPTGSATGATKTSFDQGSSRDTEGSRPIRGGFHRSREDPAQRSRHCLYKIVVLLSSLCVSEALQTTSTLCCTWRNEKALCIRANANEVSCSCGMSRRCPRW